MNNQNFIAPIDQDPEVAIARTEGKTVPVVVAKSGYQTFGRLADLLRDEDGKFPDMAGAEPLMCGFMCIIKQNDANSKNAEYRQVVDDFRHMLESLGLTEDKYEKLAKVSYPKAMNFQRNSKSLKFAYIQRDYLMYLSDVDCAVACKSNKDALELERNCYFFKYRVLTAFLYENAMLKNTFAFIINAITNAISRVKRDGTEEAATEIKYLLDALV